MSDRPRPPLLIGEAPSSTSRDPAVAFSGRSGDRLSKLLGRPVHDVFETVNVFRPDFPWKWTGKWDARTAKIAAIDLGHLLADRDVVCAGLRVARAMGGATFARTPYLTWVEYEGWRGRAAIIPHPSGRNRYWNDPANVERVRVFLQDLARGGGF